MEIESQEICRSDDPYIIALARISHTRLLFTNDAALQRDFKKIVGEGIIYTTKSQSNVTRTHRSLLGPRRQICNC